MKEIERILFPETNFRAANKRLIINDAMLLYGQV